MDVDQAYKEIKIYLNSRPGFKFLNDFIRDDDELILYVCGGVVRNKFLDPNRVSKDIDLVIHGKKFESVIEYLRRRGTLTHGPFGSPKWFPEHTSILSYDIISVTAFDNKLQRCNSIIDVLSQFDITINALAFDLRSGDFLDPVGGLAHINEKKLKAVRFDYPDVPVSKSITLSRLSVLWFRYIHYSNVFELTIEPSTLEWIEQNKWRIIDLPLFEKHFFAPQIKNHPQLKLL